MRLTKTAYPGIIDLLNAPGEARFQFLAQTSSALVLRAAGAHASHWYHPGVQVAVSAAEKILSETFGFDSFRGQQREIVETVAGGADALVLMPSGGGKSACYQMPALLRCGAGVA